MAGQNSKPKTKNRNTRTVIWAVLLIIFTIFTCFFIYWLANNNPSDFKSVLGLETTPTPTMTPTPTPTMTPTPTSTPTPTPVAGIIVIDAGHGGEDNGAAYYDECEKDIALEYALKLKEKLEIKDYLVIVTRDDDSYLSLDDRLFIANEAKADILISLHVNSYYTDTSVYGFEILYGSDRADSKLLAGVILPKALQYIDTKSRGSKPRSDLTLLVSSEMPSVLIELGFITNENELTNLHDFLYQSNLINGLYEGIVEYMESYK